jgi:hypothetical protein
MLKRFRNIISKLNDFIAMGDLPTIGIPFYLDPLSMMLNASVLYKDRIYMIAGAWQAKLNKIMSQRGEFNLWCNI